MTRFLAVIAFGLVGLYVASLVVLVVYQRRMMYFPSGPVGPASSFGLPTTQTLKLRTKDGETIVAWYQAATPGRPLFLYFHGNGGTLAIRANLLARLAEDGSGFLAIDYQGYGGSTGTPSETGLIDDGQAAYDEARKLGYGPDRIVLLGESLGTGVAVAVGAKNPIQALVLDSAYSATVDIAAGDYWMFPVRLLMLDTFESITRIGAVHAPKLFLHSEGDPIIPVKLGRKLFDAASEPKTFVTVPGHGHMVLWSPGMVDRVRAWLAGLSRETAAMPRRPEPSR